MRIDILLKRKITYMKSKLNFESFKVVLEPKAEGYLRIDGKTGQASLDDNRGIKGFKEIDGNPIASKFFSVPPTDVEQLWQDSTSFTDFCHRVSKVDQVMARSGPPVGLLSGDARPEIRKKWANIIDYENFGEWKDHGITGAYDLSGYRLDKLDGVQLLIIDLLDKPDRFDDSIYALVGYIAVSLGLPEYSFAVYCRDTEKVAEVGIYRDETKLSIPLLEIPLEPYGSICTVNSI